MEIAGLLVSIAGLVVGLVGFGVTIHGVRKSTVAATAASKAASETRDRLRKFDLVSELAGAIEEMHSILRMHRMPGTTQWAVLVDRYGYLKERLIGIHATSMEMPEQDRARVLSTITQLTTLETSVDRYLAKGGRIPSVGDINAVLSEQLGGLIRLHAAAKEEIGR